MNADADGPPASGFDRSRHCVAPGEEAREFLIAAQIGLFVVAACLSTASPAAAEVGVRNDIECLALTIYFEARGEPDMGRRAVGHVVMNRALDSRYPRWVCEVVRQGGERPRYRCQFTWWCDGRSDRPTEDRAWRESQALARAVYWGYSDDPTRGALWYHAAYVRPVWRTDLERGARIGRHIFYAARADAAPMMGRLGAVKGAIPAKELSP